ncbi:MAG: hypothetical protein CVV44_14835 [Spirochaetae bacterium HGW-Spirochaetae-1]|nr:MAG: hypothetical protein CVV44_14835 [Spirochaetae bacterium HGW-Spirochaetae-1]
MKGSSFCGLGALNASHAVWEIRKNRYENTMNGNKNSRIDRLTNFLLIHDIFLFDNKNIE